MLQLGLGRQLLDVRADPAATRGAASLGLVYEGLGDEPVLADALSDGTLGFLAIIGMVELIRTRPSNARPMLLALDEPDLHLHPRAQRYLTSFLESASNDVQILIATQSDVVLDALSEPAASVVLCELEQDRLATVLKRPDPEALAAWIDDYAGYGSLRRAGLEQLVTSAD
ncbi:MAG: ATP-binding protein [Phycisphaerales bacterium]|nr:ATP-binding protein [Phycisphaerales bacterium]